MKVILVLWALPIVLFWGWYGLSANDINLGFFFLERRFHDLVFNLYSQILHVPADAIPALLAGVFFVDTLIILGIAALRWYKLWLPQSIKWVKEKTGLAEEERVYVRENYLPFAKRGMPAFSREQVGQAGLAE